MKVRVAELANLYKHMEADCNKIKLCICCKYSGLCFKFEESEVEIDSHVFNEIKDKVFGA